MKQQKSLQPSAGGVLKRYVLRSRYAEYVHQAGGSDILIGQKGAEDLAVERFARRTLACYPSMPLYCSKE